MAGKTVKLTAPNGAAVTASADIEEELLRRGFTAESTKTTAKKSSSSKSSK